MKFSGWNALLAAAVLSLTACSSSNTVSSAVPGVDFGQYKSYGFMTTTGSDGKPYQSLETGYLRTAVSRELDARGWSQSESPDALVNFSIETQEKVRSRSVPSAGYGVGYDPYYDAYYDDWGMNHQTQISQYTEGKLNIDLIDREARRMIWQGSTKGTLTEKDYQNPQATLDGAVTEIFTQFPVAAPASTD